MADNCNRHKMEGRRYAAQPLTTAIGIKWKVGGTLKMADNCNRHKMDSRKHAALPLTTATGIKWTVGSTLHYR